MQSVRLSAEVLRAVDKLVAKLQAERPGMRVTRSDALRVLILRALAQEEEGEKPPKKP